MLNSFRDFKDRRKYHDHDHFATKIKLLELVGLDDEVIIMYIKLTYCK